MDGKRKRFNVGPWPEILLADARDRAFAVRREIALGAHGVESFDHPIPTYAEATHEFGELYAKSRNRDWRGHARLLRKFSLFDKRRITEIRRQDFARVLSI